MLFDPKSFSREPQLPAVHAVRVTTGIGKTRIAADMISASVKAGETPNKPWIYFVPTHRLGDEIVELFAGHGVRAKVWRGRAANIPGDPNRTMCSNLDAVKLAVKAGLPVSETCCKSEKKGQKKTCPFFSVCAYQKQKNIRPDVWIAAHEALFHDNESFGEPAGVIVDESFWQDGLRIPNWNILVADIRSSVLGKEDAAADLDVLRNRLADVLDAQGDGPLEIKNLSRETVAHGMHRGNQVRMGSVAKGWPRTWHVKSRDAKSQRPIAAHSVQSPFDCSVASSARNA